MSKIATAEEAVRHIKDDCIIAVNSSSGLCCPDAVLAAREAIAAHAGDVRSTRSPPATCSERPELTTSPNPVCLQR